jgi:hypothetical protein
VASLVAWALAALAIHLVLGSVFAVPFVVAGAGRTDPSARGGSIGFRLVIVPGVALFWPLMLHRWWRGVGAPPIERGAHRVR